MLNSNSSGVNYNFGEVQAASVSGYVYNDANGNSSKDSGEAGLGGVTVTLTGTDDLGASVSMTQTSSSTTGSVGAYSFTGLRPGTYVVSETPPSGYVRTGNSVGTVNGSADGALDAALTDIIKNVVLPSGSSGINYNFGQWTKPASISGFVFDDINDNGTRDAGDIGIKGVTVKLYNSGGQVVGTTTTASDGSYSFNSVPAGTYKLVESQPSGYLQGVNSVGTVNGNADGSLSTTDTIASIAIATGNAGVNYNFGELGQSCGISSCQTANISYWHCSTGQSLIKAFNGSSTSTTLATWLATSFPNLYGAGAGASNLIGKTNADVATLFQSLYQSGSQVDEQFLATALSVYATTSSLGGAAGASYGFSVSALGLGAGTYNIGTNGAAFGVSNGTSLTVIQILQAVNAKSKNGSFFNGNSTYINQAITVLNGINNS